MTDLELLPERYRQILDTAPDAMIVLNRDARIVYANRQSRGLFGIASEDLVGQKLDLLLPPRFRAAHARHLERYFATPTVRPMGSGVSLFGLRADGSEVPIEVSLSPVGDGSSMLVCAAIRDISERKQIEASAKLAADRLASAVESIKEPFALFDGQRKLVQCNSAYRRFVAESVTGPVLGARLADLSRVWMDQLAPSSGARRLSPEDPAATFDVQLGQRNYRISNQPTLEGGVVQTIWDLTEDFQREEELRVARTYAEAGSAAKTDFLSSMSHELRTPLNAVLGFAQLLQRDKKEPLSERQRERAAQILKGGEHLLRLIDDILDLSRIEAGHVAISPESVDVSEVLEETRNTLTPTAHRSEISLAIAPIAADLPPINADRTRFSQILMNLASNAIKYNRRGGKVTFVASRNGDYVRVTISDTGLGVPLDKQEKLFQPFQRAGQETGPIEGTGIGLVITKRLAEFMNGTVGFQSVPDEGSEFWVELPVLSESVRPAVTLADTRVAATLTTEGVERLVLYVEDNPANVAFMRDLLSGLENVALTTAPTAEMGLELASAQTPDVILLDINLPGMSGLDALRALRQTPETRDIPVIALTAAASERDRKRGEQAGFFRYLTKPVNVDELESALASVFARPRAQGQIVSETDSE